MMTIVNYGYLRRYDDENSKTMVIEGDTTPVQQNVVESMVIYGDTTALRQNVVGTEQFIPQNTLPVTLAQFSI